MERNFKTFFFLINPTKLLSNIQNVKMFLNFINQNLKKYISSRIGCYTTSPDMFKLENITIDNCLWLNLSKKYQIFC